MFLVYSILPVSLWYPGSINVAMLEENVLIFSRFYPLSLWALPMPFGGLLSCFTLRLEAGIIAAPKQSAWNYPQQVFPGWPQILGGSLA